MEVIAMESSELSNEGLVLLEKYKIIYILEPIGESTVRRIQESIIRLKALGSPLVTIYISSIGGDVVYGLQIYDLLREYAGEKTGIIIGAAASMAPVIFQACDKRILMRHAQVLIHHVSLSICPSIDALKDQDEYKRMIASLEDKQGRINKILLSRSRITPDDLDALCKKDEYISAEEALNLGFIDKIKD
jgi:ATP-dependent protease ClpP protease subunit